MFTETMEQQQPYISCIKINGIPILPPLMTENMRAEMNYYKQLAIAVEKRLKILEIGKQTERNECVETIIEEDGQNLDEKFQKGDSLDSVTEDSSVTETEISTVDSAPNMETVIDLPIKDTAAEQHFSSLDTTMSEYFTETIDQSSTSFYNNEINNKVDEVFTSSTCSDNITASTDLNQYLDVSPSTQQTTAATTPEFMKPQVPKTLDIIPITVDIPAKEKSDEVQEKSAPPKLIRQGSYILEAPSPMLLAHMQTELANPEYVPTATNQGMKRKEWNISQAKCEWENQTRNKELIIPANGTKNNSGQGRYRRNSMSGVSNQKIFKSINSKTSCFGSHNQSARSVDCIQTMLDKELLCKSSGNRANSCNQKLNFKDSSTTKNNNPQKWKSSKNVSILNLANSFGGSLGSLANSRREGIKNNRSKSAIIEVTPSRSKSAVVSEKLVIIFKEIERKHEEQMAELIAKQQKEQKNVQKEFERQQVLLLGYIKKTFPDISIPQPSKVIPDITQDNLSNCSQTLNPQTENEDVSPPDNNIPLVSKCPLDYIYPLNGCCEVSPCKNTDVVSHIETSEDEDSKGDEFPLQKNSKTTERSVEKYSNVSRQLFPLDSNTVHVPVPVNVFYTPQQIKAATVINAYARGYLVRRLMKTKQVIALKNTYKEALHCMLELHVDAPLNLSDFKFHQRLQLQCDGASMNITELFAQSLAERMRVISHDRDLKRPHSERPSSAQFHTFATQRRLVRRKLKDLGYDTSSPSMSRPSSAGSRCQTWTPNSNEKRSPNIYHEIKRSTSAGTVQKPWK